MRILINSSLLRFGGAVQVALSVIEECRRHYQHEYHLVVGPGVASVLSREDFGDNFRFYEKSFGVMRLLKLPRVQREMSEIEAKVRPECVITTSGPSYWRSQAPQLIGFNLPLYLYPESPYLTALPPFEKARLAARRWLHCRYFRRDADALIVQTDDANQRVRALLGTDRVFTVTNTHNSWYEEPNPDESRLPQRPDHVFRLLTLSSYYAHKNLELIPKIIEELPDSLQSRVEFVLTLTEEEYRSRINKKIPQQVRLIGPVPPPECPSLYMECDGMFLPTLAECFSASYPEAMKMRKPIVTSDLGFARSICGNAALFFTPCDARSAAMQIGRLVDDPGLQRDLTERGQARLRTFDTPAKRTEKILKICEKLAQENARAGSISQ